MAEEASFEVVASDPAWWSALGDLHPALVHFPLAWIVLLTVSFSWRRLLSLPDKGWRLLAAITWAAFVPAIASGFVKQTEVEDPNLWIHRLLTLVAMGLVTLAIVWERWLGSRSATWSRRGTLLWLWLGTALVLAGGFFGGRVAHALVRG